MTVAVRYIVSNVDEALPFYIDLLGFKLEMHPAPPFAQISKDGVNVYLNQPGGGGGAGQDVGGQTPEPGGWNRLQISVDDLDAVVGRMRGAGAHFRGDIIQGNGGRQILVDDPSGNPVELFEPRSR